MKYTIYIFIIISCLACTGRTIYKKPDNLIAKGQMIDIWTDIYIANAAKSVKSKKLYKRVNYMPFVYKKYNIDSVRFMQSNIYYTSKIEEYEKMFQEVERRIIRLKDMYDPESIGIDPSLPIYVRDSLKRSKLLEKREEIQSKNNIDLEKLKNKKSELESEEED